VFAAPVRMCHRPDFELAGMRLEAGRDTDGIASEAELLAALVGGQLQQLRTHEKVGVPEEAVYNGVEVNRADGIPADIRPPGWIGPLLVLGTIRRALTA